MLSIVNMDMTDHRWKDATGKREGDERKCVSLSASLVVHALVQAWLQKILNAVGMITIKLQFSPVTSVSDDHSRFDMCLKNGSAD